MLKAIYNSAKTAKRMAKINDQDMSEASSVTSSNKLIAHQMSTGAELVRVLLGTSSILSNFHVGFGSRLLLLQESVK